MTAPKVSRYLTVSERSYENASGERVRLLLGGRTGHFMAVPEAVGLGLAEGVVPSDLNGLGEALTDAEILVPGDEDEAAVADRSQPGGGGRRREPVVRAASDGQLQHGMRLLWSDPRRPDDRGAGTGHHRSRRCPDPAGEHAPGPDHVVRRRANDGLPVAAQDQPDPHRGGRSGGGGLLGQADHQRKPADAGEHRRALAGGSRGAPGDHPGRTPGGPRCSSTPARRRGQLPPHHQRRPGRPAAPRPRGPLRPLPHQRGRPQRRARGRLPAGHAAPRVR